MTPTARQEQAWCLHTAGLSNAAIAERMDVSTTRVGQYLTAYRRRTGAARHYGDGPAAQKAARYREMVARLEAAEQRIADLEEENEQLRQAAAPWQEVHRKLDAILARPSTLPTVTHRRRADGGIGGRRERKVA